MPEYLNVRILTVLTIKSEIELKYVRVQKPRFKIFGRIVQMFMYFVINITVFFNATLI